MTLLEKLESLRRRHYYCEDSWYSCPLAEDGTCNDLVPQDVCNCTADRYNAILDEVIAELARVL